MARRSEAKRVRRELAKVERERAMRRRARRRVLQTIGTAAAIALVFVLLGLLVLRGGTGGVAFAGDFRPGGVVKSLKLPALDTGTDFDYARVRDRPVVLNFFASWCPFCIGEMPDFQKVHRELGRRVTFVGVSQSDSRSASIDLVHQTGVTYQTAIDAQGSFYHAVGTTGMPTTLFIRPGGRVAYVQVGPLDRATLESYIARYLRVRV
jgi:thiol-disulfide isomerase/thioredoxin